MTNKSESYIIGCTNMATLKELGQIMDGQEVTVVTAHKMISTRSPDGSVRKVAYATQLDDPEAVLHITVYKAITPPKGTVELIDTGFEVQASTDPRHKPGEREKLGTHYSPFRNFVEPDLNGRVNRALRRRGILFYIGRSPDNDATKVKIFRTPTG